MEPKRNLRPHEEVVERALEWVAVAILGLNLPLSSVRALRNPEAYVHPFAIAVLCVLWALLLLAILSHVRRRTAARPLRATVAVGGLALVLHPFVRGEAPAAYPPLLHVIGATAAVSPVLGVPLSAVLIPAFAAFVAYLRAPTLGVGPAVAEALLLAVSALLATVSVDLLRRANRSVVSAVRSVSSAAENKLRAGRRAYEREHWNGLVHDKVIGALQLVTRDRTSPAPSEAARELAAQAIAAFRGDPLPEDATVADAVIAHARLLELQVEVAVEGDVPDPEVRAALADAAKEALTNVSRHAGTHRARVRGQLDDRSALLVITDAGRGFDATAPTAGRGITTSLHGRMIAVGGTANLTSSPGSGTEVSLTWVASAAKSTESNSEWQLRTFAPAMGLGGLAVLMNVVIGAQQWRHDRWPAITYLCLGAVVLITAGATWIRPTGYRWLPIVLTAAVVVGLLTANIPKGASTDWRYWYLGALTPAVGALAFRFAPWVGLATATLLTLTVGALDAFAGRHLWDCLGGPVPVLFAVGVAGQGIRASMDRAWQRVNEAEAHRAQIRLSAAAQEERSREAAARVAALTDTVAPWLNRIAAGHTVSPEERARLALLESSIRDHLAGPDLLNAALVGALHESRSHGVQIVVAQGTPVDEGTDGAPVPTQARHVYRTVFIELLRTTEADDVVRAVWGPLTPGTCGTISVVSAEQEAHAPRWDRLDDFVLSLPDTHRPVVTRDETCLLVEFPLTAPLPT